MQCGIWEKTACYSKDTHHNSTTLPKQHLTHQEWALDTKQKPTNIASLLYQQQSAGCLPNIKSKTTHMPVKKTVNSLGPIVNSLHFTSLNWTSSTSRCRGFTKSFPSLTISSYNSYSVPFNSRCIQNLLYTFFPSPSRPSCGFLPLCSSLPGHFGVPLISILTTCPNHLNCATCMISE